MKTWQLVNKATGQLPAMRTDSPSIDTFTIVQLCNCAIAELPNAELPPAESSIAAQKNDYVVLRAVRTLAAKILVNSTDSSISGWSRFFPRYPANEITFSQVLVSESSSPVISSTINTSASPLLHNYTITQLHNLKVSRRCRPLSAQDPPRCGVRGARG